jgi:integrase
MPAFIAKLLADYMAIFVGPDPDAWLFPTPDGKPVRQSAFYKRVFKPAVRSTLPDKQQLRFHDLRHTAASFILAVHPNPFLVMKRLGHASMVTTTKTYGHLVGDVDAMLATALDDFNKQTRDSSAAYPAALTLARKSTHNRPVMCLLSSHGHRQAGVCGAPTRPPS